MPDQVHHVTPEGFERLKRELDQLLTVHRPRVIVQLKEALEQASAQASPLENPDYAAAKNEQSFIEGRILELESIVKTAVLIDSSQKRETVGLGSKVTITEGPDGSPERYVVVGSVEADPLHGYISNASPLGRALMGHRAGDWVVVNAPDGEIEFRIVALE
ncbi:MAG: transcription elongation factor GreA [Anaerolineae bacterium]|nr:transcription elongation factor GreA [Anaerolineae bacterium]